MQKNDFLQKFLKNNLVNTKSYLFGTLLLSVLMASCCCDQNDQSAEKKVEYGQKLVVVNEPIPSEINEPAVVMRALKDGKLHVLSYDKDDALWSFFKYGDTAVISNWEPYRDLDLFDLKHFYTSDYPVSYEDKKSMWKKEKILWVNFSEKTKSMLLERRSKNYLTTQEIEIANTIMTQMLAINPGQRENYIDNIQNNGTDTQKKCLQYALESVQYEKDIIEWAATKKRLAKQNEIQQKQENESRILKSKKDGTLGQYLTDTKGSIRDTATIVRVYKERRKSLEGTANYTSISNGMGGGGGLVIGVIGGAGGGGVSSSNANGGAVLSGNDKMIQTVIAKDQYGYTYTFELEPEMNCKVGDQIVLDYFGRVADAARFFDKVLVQNIIYKSL